MIRIHAFTMFEGNDLGFLSLLEVRFFGGY